MRKETSRLRCSSGCSQAPQTSLWAAGLEGPKPNVAWDIRCGRDQVLQAHGQVGLPGQLAPQMPETIGLCSCMQDIYSIKTIIKCLLNTMQAHGDKFVLQLVDILEQPDYPWKWNTWRILLWTTRGFWRRSICPQMYAQLSHPTSSISWHRTGLLTPRRWKAPSICAIAWQECWPMAIVSRACAQSCAHGAGSWWQRSSSWCCGKNRNFQAMETGRWIYSYSVSICI